SSTEAQGVRDVLGEAARVLLVPNGIASSDFKVAPYPIRDGLQVCFLGHVQQEKGINAFIRTWLEIRHPSDTLVIAGRSVDGVYFQEFQALVEQAQGAIRYLGYLERGEVMDVLAASHFLVLPSGLEEAGGMRENFGNVVAEAMAAGRPVLVAKGLAWDDVEPLGTGFVFDRNGTSVGEVLRKAQSLDRLTWEQMAWNARNFAEQQLDALKLGDRVWQALTQAGQTASLNQKIKASLYE
ncbi:MAG: glycosyltransferase family 4 protein, partial [Methylovulum sp.]|nr:glycosyltransferase family 4 protein [Methylovulum sp.]